MTGTRIGVAIGNERLTADLGKRGGATRWFTRSWGGGTQPDWDSLAKAMAELRSLAGASHCSLSVAALPPIVRTRRVILPDLPETELRRILARSPERFFPRLEGTQLIGLTRVPDARKGNAWLVSILDEAWGEGLREAAGRADCEILRIVPAYDSLAAAAADLWPSSQTGPFVLGYADEKWFEAVHLEEGQPLLVRSAPTATILSSAQNLLELTRGDGGSPSFGLATAPATREIIETLLRADGVSALPAAKEYRDFSGEQVVAMGALRSEVPLTSEREFEGGQRRRLRTAATLLAGAAMLLLVAMALSLASLRDQLEVVRLEREQIADEVRVRMSVRDSLDRILSEVEALNATIEGSTRWSLVLAELGPRIPADAYLVSFRGEEGRVHLAGVARDALGAIRTLGSTPGISGVTPDGPVRRTVDSGGFTTERFAVSASIPLITLDPEVEP